MTDPLDTLHRPIGSTEPDPAFRAALIARLTEALASSSSSTTHWSSSTDELHEPMEVDVLEPNPLPTGKRRSLIVAALATAAALLVVGGLVVLNREDASDPSPVGDTLGPTTTSVPAMSDADIAAAGVLDNEHVGGGYRQVAGGTFDLDAADGPGAASPLCAPFLDTVFENRERPANIAIQAFSTSGAAMQQYVVVFADKADADAMMASTSDPSFAACMAAVATEAYTSLDGGVAHNRSPLTPVPPRALAAIGDEMAVVALSGSFDINGVTYADEGLIPFVRVGRAITWMNPNSAETVTGEPGYTDEQLQQALASAVEQLRTAQGL